jgi:hypothetical protein
VFHHPTVDEDVLNVPESLDPNELSEILEQMEKYTAPPNSSFAITADTTNMTTTAHPQTMQQIADFVNKRRAEEESLLWETVATEPPSLSEQPAGPSLFQRNQLTIDDDDECDLESQGVRVYRFSRTANSPTICYNSHSDSYLGQRMLSLQHSSRHAPFSVGIQHNVDMFEFELEPQLKHCAVCPAIGFVQASKRTKRCILYTEWFVFIVDQRKLIFIYRRGATSSWQPQAIVDLSAVISGPPESLDILGLQQINDWQFMGLTSTHCFTLTLKQQAMNF